MLIKDMRQGDKSSPYVIFLDKLIPVQLAFVQAAHLWLLKYQVEVDTDQDI